jgi:hypothetical protein
MRRGLQFSAISNSLSTVYTIKVIKDGNDRIDERMESIEKMKGENDKKDERIEMVEKMKG